MLGNEVAGDGDNIVRPLAQGGNGDGKDIEPVVKVFAEDALGHGFRHVAVGGGNDADVERHRLLAADPLDLSFLQHAQQLGLQAHLHLGHFVEEQGAILCLFELAGLRLLRPGESPFFIAEQGGFEQAIRNGGAVDGNERPHLARRIAMNEASDHFLANARFSGKQHRGIGLGDALGNGKQFAAGRIVGHHAHLVIGRGQFVFVDVGEQGLWLERLEQEIASPGAHGIHRLVHFSIGRHQHHRQMRQAGADFLEQGDAVHRHHAHIADHDGKSLFRQYFQGRLATIDRHVGATGKFQRIADRFTQTGIVLNDQDRQCMLRHSHLFRALPKQPAMS